MWGCLDNVMMPHPMIRKIGSKTSNCIFIGYANNSSAYRFLVINRDLIENNTIVTKNAEFFEHIFPLKRDNISHESTF